MTHFYKWSFLFFLCVSLENSVSATNESRGVSDERSDEILSFQRSSRSVPHKDHRYKKPKKEDVDKIFPKDSQALDVPLDKVSKKTSKIQTQEDYAEKQRAYAERMGVEGARDLSVSISELNERIACKKAEKKQAQEDYAEKQRAYAERMGVDGARDLSVSMSELSQRITYKKKEKLLQKSDSYDFSGLSSLRSVSRLEREDLTRQAEKRAYEERQAKRAKEIAIRGRPSEIKAHGNFGSLIDERNRKDRAYISSYNYAYELGLVPYSSDYKTFSKEELNQKIDAEKTRRGIVKSLSLNRPFG